MTTTTELIGMIVVIFASAIGFAVIISLMLVGGIVAYHAILRGTSDSLAELKQAARIGETVRGFGE